MSKIFGLRPYPKEWHEDETRDTSFPDGKALPQFGRKIFFPESKALPLV
jgi:hypothetical protein